MNFKKSFHCFAILLTIFLFASPSQAQNSPVEYSQLTPLKFGFDIIPFVGTSTAMHGNDLRLISLNLIGGYSGGVDAFEASTVLNINNHSVSGVQLVGLGNIVGGPMRGLQLAGGFNLVADQVYGFQAAGGVNIVAAQLKGLQAAGGVNIVAKDGIEKGLQIAGAANCAIGPVYGAQISGAANIAIGPMQGLQAAGALNVAEAVNGLQLVGALNVATDSVDGAQIGAANIAVGEVKGVQIGVLNISQNTDAAVGLFSIAWDGNWDLDLNAAHAGMGTIAVRNSARHTHSMITLGAHPIGKKLIYVWGAGFGGHFNVIDNLGIDLDLLANTLHKESTYWKNSSLLASVRAIAHYRLTDFVSLYAGPSYNILVSENLKAGRFSWFGLRHVRKSGEDEAEVNPDVFLWPGLEAGVRFHLR